LASDATLRLLCILLLAAPAVIAEDEGPTAAELIEQAHQYDGRYNATEQANQQKAISLYAEALEAKPDSSQRLHILYRMAQLNGCIYNRQKGERPDYRKAIELYKEIVESYPPEEPLVLKAMGFISDHYTSLREFEAALRWAKRALEYDTTKVEEKIADIQRKLESLKDVRYAPDERQAIIEEALLRRPVLRENLEKVKRDRVIAVDRIAHSAELIDPLRAHGELRSIVQKYGGTPIGRRAAQRLQENMDRWPDLWVPDDQLPGDHSESSLQVGPGNASALGQGAEGLGPRPDGGLRAATGPLSQGGQRNEKPNNDVLEDEQPRAPPLGTLSACIVGAVGLIIIGVAAPRMRRNASAKGLKK
jgi:tetratricopeptide (TPR) repeat protein